MTFTYYKETLEVPMKKIIGLLITLATVKILLGAIGIHIF
jgi:hypothetical protein